MAPLTAAHAADLGLPPPPPLVEEVPCVGCTGPVYLKGFIGAANPVVDGIDTELYQYNDFTVVHEDIKSSPLFGLGIGYQFNNWLRFDMTGEYRGKSLFIAQDKYPGGNGTFSRASNDADGTFLPGTNTRPTSRAGSVCGTPMPTSAPIGASRLMSVPVSVSPRCPCSA